MRVSQALVRAKDNYFNHDNRLHFKTMSMKSRLRNKYKISIDIHLILNLVEKLLKNLIIPHKRKTSFSFLFSKCLDSKLIMIFPHYPQTLFSEHVSTDNLSALTYTHADKMMKSHS